MRYYEVKFNITPDSENARDLVAALAGDAGFESFDETADGFKGYVQIENFDKTAFDAELSDFPLKGTKVDYVVSEVNDEDWNSVWEDNGFKPILIDDKCVIYDAKDADNIVADSSLPQLKIGIEAKQAFGTGTHETTQMMVSTLLSMDLKGKNVLDCGCGTGILGIVAKKLGANKVVGYDIDDWSVRNAQHNAELNGVEIEVLEGDKRVLSHVSGVFNVVLANINRNILLADMPAICDVMDSDPKLVISGFYEEDIPALLDKAGELGFHEKSRKTKDNWACLLLEHK